MGTPFGFPDWQNQRPLDGPLLIDTNAVASLQSNIFGPVYVGRWARIAGDAFITNQPAVWTFSWYADQALTKLIGQRRFVTNHNIGDPCRFMLPNLGPWLRVSYSCPNVLPTPVITHHAYGTNREQPVESVGGQPNLIGLEALAVGAGSTTQLWPSGYYAGRAKLWLTCGGTFGFGIFAYHDATSTFRIYNQGAAAASADINIEIILPLGAFFLSVNNTAGVASTIYAGLWPDTSAG